MSRKKINIICTIPNISYDRTIFSSTFFGNFNVNLYKPVFQAFLGFLVMATAIVETPVYFVVISCLLNIVMCGVSFESDRTVV